MEMKNDGSFEGVKETKPMKEKSRFPKFFFFVREDSPSDHILSHISFIFIFLLVKGILEKNKILINKWG